jgi:hypothetical protein
MIFEIYLTGVVVTTITISYVSKPTGTIIDGLIPIFALIGGAIWPIVIITTICSNLIKL